MLKANTFRSRKQKGKRLEIKVAKRIREMGLDVDAKRMPGSGAFDGFKGDIYTKLPYSWEIKNQEKVTLWEWWEQTKAQETPYKPGILVVGGNFRPALAVMDLDTFLNLLLEIKQYEKV
jgi:hypothetical protein